MCIGLFGVLQNEGYIRFDICNVWSFQAWQSMLNNGMAWGSQSQNFSWQNNAKQMEKSEIEHPKIAHSERKFPVYHHFPRETHQLSFIKVSTMLKDAPKYFHGWLVNIRMLSD